MSIKGIADILSGMGHAAPRVGAFLDTLSPGDAARLLQAADSGDTRPLLKAFADQTWTATPARSAQPLPSEAKARIPLDERLARDPNIRAGVEDAGMSTAGMNNQQMLEAYAEAFRNAGARRGGPKSTEDSIREMVRPPADQVAAENIASQFDRVIGGDVPTRQMELPMGDEPTGLVPFGVRGPGVLVDSGRGMISADGAPSTELMAPSTGLGRPRLPRLPDKRLSKTVDLERMPHPRPVISQPGPRRLPGTVADDMPPNIRVVDEAKPRSRRLAKGVGAGIAGAGAAYWAANSGNELGNESAAFQSGGEADLAAETSPPPAVAATAETPEPTVVQAPRDYSKEARALIDRLNDMRRAAPPEVLRANGGDIPEARAMKAEIERLLALGNQTRRATYVAAPQDDAGRLYQQAQGLIDQVNRLQSQGYPHGSPQVQSLMRQVRQLQSQGDAIRNRRAG